MEYRKLGRSGLQVSTICLGAMTFGEPDASSFMHGIATNEETALAMMDRAFEKGVNFLDTADVYGNDGLSERVVGKWLGARQMRDAIVLATKFRFRMSAGPNGTGASRFRIVRTVEESLRRLGTDRIDLYQIHMQDLDTPEEETLRALDDLVRAGKVLYLGCSNYAAYRLVDSLWTSRVQHLESFVSLQAQYSLVHRELEREHVPLSEKFGLGILPWSPLAGGFLSGKYKRGEAPKDGSRYAKWKERFASFDHERNWKTLDAVDAIAKETGSTPSAVSLAWLLRKPAVTSVIIGTRTLAQLDDNLAGVELALTDAHVATLDQASAFPLGYPYEFIAGIQKKW
jgi:aryl-alcohol dehydrogenase-like predicted oxidoreductase